jgi:hypothetical protein
LVEKSLLPEVEVVEREKGRERERVVHSRFEKREKERERERERLSVLLVRSLICGAFVAFIRRRLEQILFLSLHVVLYG